MRTELIKSARHTRRVRRVRNRVTGTSARPRLAVTRSNCHIYAQIIDDSVGRTLCASSSLAKEFKGQIGYGGNVKAAGLVGRALGEKASALGISTVCFDRRGQKFHGRIKALAEAVREAGLKF
ncbi:MAG: 50S ribosomal protein L18 [Planctomycetes bacterium]|nr:50S ribosomal protein L18 [Planctomycetota bacterium]